MTQDMNLTSHVRYSFGIENLPTGLDGFSLTYSDGEADCIWGYSFGGQGSDCELWRDCASGLAQKS
ncbi:hypothetical protein MUK42_37790 [Musa troglodytarum]|uniref:Uncharacterized protein n=1 Tax=Musa troglodytarum TaxID=320322 RepID=A0A9E7K418_9LILI|nr:hypothetical protein MUK42_37790 [Musa troglodytarum]